MMYDNLKNALQDHKITQQEFAEFLGISKKTVVNKLNGTTDFTYPEYRKTCKFLFPEMNPDYLFAVISICIGCYSLGWSLRGLAERYAEQKGGK